MDENRCGREEGEGQTQQSIKQTYNTQMFIDNYTDVWTLKHTWKQVRFDNVVILVHILASLPKETNTNFPKISNTYFIHCGVVIGGIFIQFGSVFSEFPLVYIKFC